MELPDKVKRALRELPDEPGCYLMRDKRGTIIYVGKAVSLRRRVQSYFRSATVRHADPKLRGLIRSVADIDVVVLRNEAEALLTEGRLIKDYRPRYNVDFKDDKRFLLIRVNIHDPFPVFRAVRLRREDGALYFGPYASSSSARAAMEFAQKKFGLRRCSPRVPGPEDHRHCIDDIVRFCSAPCLGRISSDDYRQRIEDACAFLKGERPQDLKALREAMKEAAAKRDFERAAVLRDTLHLLETAIRQRARVASTPDMARRDAEEGIKVLRDHLRLDRVPGLIEAFDISNISGTLAVAGMVCAVNGLPDRRRYRRFRIRTVSGSDDPAMMAEVIRRRYSRVREEGGIWPDLILVDGGQAQRNAAAAVLDSLGKSDLPVVGLAKRLEEVYPPGGGKPLLLPAESSALHIFQRLRDEAHRFALTYHRHLRARRISESVLDDIPGIGLQRKKILLRRFGSVQRLRKVTAEKIEETVPGIGLELARQILDALNPRPGG